MKSCRRWRARLVEAVYDEITPQHRKALEAHLTACPRCAAELEGMRATASYVDEALPPRPQGAELEVWNRLLPAIEALERPAPRRLVLAYPLAASLAVALLVIGLGVGMLMGPSRPSQPTQLAATPSPPQEKTGVVFGAELARYLERATPLLLAVANRQVGSSEVTSFDPLTERQLAERLATDAERLAQSLAAAGQRRQADLVADLGVVFLQMANLPPREYRRGIEMVQSTIESRALLFQLSVEEMRHL